MWLVLLGVELRRRALGCAGPLAEGAAVRDRQSFAGDTGATRMVAVVA